MQVNPNRRPVMKGMTWPTHLLGENSDMEIDATVASLAEAEERAERMGYELSVDVDARAEMVKAGVAPARS